MEEFLRYFKWVLVSRDEFERFKNADPETLTDIQRAARFFYLHQCAFAGSIIHPTFGTSACEYPRLNLLRLEKYLSAVHLRLAKVYIECLPYSDLISRYNRPDTFFYIDPPYWDCETYYGKGIFRKEDFGKLTAQLATIKRRFILSLNAPPGVCEVFKDFKTETVQTKYTCSKMKTIPAAEVLISNF